MYPNFRLPIFPDINLISNCPFCKESGIDMKNTRYSMHFTFRIPLPPSFFIFIDFIKGPYTNIPKQNNVRKRVKGNLKALSTYI